MSAKRLVTVRRQWIGYMGIGLVAVVAVVSAAFAQAPRVAGHGKPAGTAIEAGKRQPQQRRGSGTRATVALPTGNVGVGPEFVDGEPIYVRRTTVRPGMTIVEVSTTPFMPVLSSNEARPGAPRPDQPASW
jgi:hypothetical protein